MYNKQDKLRKRPPVKTSTDSRGNVAFEESCLLPTVKSHSTPLLALPLSHRFILHANVIPGCYIIVTVMNHSSRHEKYIAVVSKLCSAEP